MQRRWVRSITLLTPPPIVLLDNLLVTPHLWTSGITESLVFDEIDGRSGRKVFRLVARPDILILDLSDRLDFFRSDGLSSGSSDSSAHPRVCIRLVLYAVTLRIEPENEGSTVA
jgi:hypothetical protein